MTDKTTPQFIYTRRDHFRILLDEYIEKYGSKKECSMNNKLSKNEMKTNHNFDEYHKLISLLYNAPEILLNNPTIL